MCMDNSSSFHHFEANRKAHSLTVPFFHIILLILTHRKKISQKLAVHLEEDSICNSKVTKMCSTLQQPSQPTSSLACKGNEKKRKMPFDTSPTLICPVAKKRSAHQPSYDIRSINCQRSNSDGSKCYAFGIRIISPTHDGINEASRKLRSSFSSSGIVSIPTEKEYALLSYVPFQKPTYTSRTPQDTRRRAWDTSKCILIICLALLENAFY